MVWYHSATILTERRVKRKRKKEVKGREATWMRSATERNAHELQALGHRVLKKEKEKKKKIIVCF